MFWGCVLQADLVQMIVVPDPTAVSDQCTVFRIAVLDTEIVKTKIRSVQCYKLNKSAIILIFIKICVKDSFYYNFIPNQTYRLFSSHIKFYKLPQHGNSNGNWLKICFVFNKVLGTELTFISRFLLLMVIVFILLIVISSA